MELIDFELQRKSVRFRVQATVHEVCLGGRKKAALGGYASTIEDNLVLWLRDLQEDCLDGIGCTLGNI